MKEKRYKIESKTPDMLYLCLSFFLMGVSAFLMVISNTAWMMLGLSVLIPTIGNILDHCEIVEIQTR